MVSVVTLQDNSFCYKRHAIMVIYVQSPQYKINTHLVIALLCITRGCSGCCCAILRGFLQNKNSATTGAGLHLANLQ